MRTLADNFRIYMKNTTVMQMGVVIAGFLDYYHARFELEVVYGNKNDLGRNETDLSQ